METLHDYEGWPPGPIHLAIGVFDGVHLGHRALVAELARDARREHGTAVAATFDPIPIQVLAPGAPPSALSDLRQRTRLLRDAGADAIVVFHFDKAFSLQTADEFVDRVLGAGDVRRILVGPDFQFGNRAKGNVDLLRARAARDGFELAVMPMVESGGAVVSSTRIRNLLIAGDIEGAARLLGRPYSVGGRVLRGATHGHELGFPTIDVALPNERLLPRDGIYALWAEMGEGRLKAAGSIGIRPGVGGGERMLEAYLLDLEGAVRGDEEIEITFVTRLRDELAFETSAELAAQIARDVEETRQALDG